MTDTDKEYEEQARLREDELMALEAILPSTDLGRSASSMQEIWLSVPIVLPESINVVVRSHCYSSANQLPRDVLDRTAYIHEKDNRELKLREETTTLLGVCHLPPLRLLIQLPLGYPSLSAPHIVSISGELLTSDGFSRPGFHRGDRQAKEQSFSLSASWQAGVVLWLREALQKQWQEFEGEILYTWYEYLKESLWQDLLPSSDKMCPLIQGEPAMLLFEEFLVEEEGEKNVGNKFESPLATSIRSYDILTKRKRFEGERYGCGICLEEKRGGKCWKVGNCGHVFCQDCLSSYLSSMIREGYIRQASACPDPECVKARVMAENKEDEELKSGTIQAGAISQVELLQFVGPELVARLADLREKALASTDPSAGYCPRPGCERLVRQDAKDIGTVYESMRMCECGFTYCLYCNKAWHGKSPCNLISSTALIEKYQQTAEGSKVRREMEMRYGKNNLEKMVRNHEEEMQNRAYIESNTQRCPCCSIRIEKSIGCNHMTCRSCHTHLCYRCGTRLNPNDPYRHFNTPGTPCFQKLFDALSGTGGPQDEWGFIDAAEEEDIAQWEAEQL